jgi:hypothetical protein
MINAIIKQSAKVPITVPPTPIIFLSKYRDLLFRNVNFKLIADYKIVTFDFNKNIK